MNREPKEVTLTEYLNGMRSRLNQPRVGAHNLVIADAITQCSEHDSSFKRVELVFISLDEVCKPIRRIFTNPKTQGGIMRDFYTNISGEELPKGYIPFKEFLNLKNLKVKALINRSNNPRYMDVKKILARLF